MKIYLKNLISNIQKYLSFLKHYRKKLKLYHTKIWDQAFLFKKKKKAQIGNNLLKQSLVAEAPMEMSFLFLQC